MAIKRKSRSATTDTSAAKEDSRVNKRTSSAAAVEADGGIVAEEQVAASASVSAVDEADEKVNSPPVQIDNPEEEEEEEDGCKFLGEPVPENEARARWPHRYQESKTEVVQARCHFSQAEVDGQVYCLEDDAYVKGEPGKPNYIGRIIEIFKAVDGSQNFAAQWYYRGGDTVLQKCDYLIDSKCIFFSEIKDDNPLDCLVKKLKIGVLPLKADLEVKEDLKSTCDYYYAKKYLLPYSSFVNLLSDNYTNSDESGSTVSSDGDGEVSEHNNERTLLDLYSGCGGMSTGLCLGANSCGVKLVTKWAVDINEHACESLKLNHPETQVRNEPADRFLHLLKEWEKLSITISEHGIFNDMEDDESDEEDEAAEDDSEVFEVDEIVDVCYGDPNKTGTSKLHFKIRWKGYGPNADTWEPLEGLSGCPEKLKEYVSRGNKTKMLPLPGTVDVLCGGPPCQGISGFNRFRNTENPLQDEKNEQLSIFMDIVAYLRPKFVLMENVVDIVRFAGGFLGRYALGRLLSMDYQARMGMMAAGAYGLPQFRMRMFMWGALPTERLPQYPLPTHNVVVRGNAPTEFEANVVAYEERREVNLARELLLGDAISDLPPVANNESRDEMPYGNDPETEFQRFIRLRKNEMPGSLMFNSEVMEHSLYDHRPLQLNQDDYERVCRIPKKKGANFRDLPGVRVLEGNNKVEWDPAVERQTVSSGKPLVPDYAMTFVRGTSSKPFGRLWWDETVPTVVTRAEPHNQVILHPLQDRVLTIRENARLQGFPDHYKLVGPIKERYKQVGNAVAVPVARALGFSLALALRGLSGNEPVLALPEDYPLMRDVPSPTIVML